MDINALLSPYGRDFAPGVDQATDTTMAITEPAAQVLPETGLWFHGELVPETAVAADDSVASDEADSARADEVPTTDTTDTTDTIEAINALDQIEQVDLLPLDEPVRSSGKHRADVPADSVSPLVATVATHRLSA